MIMSYLDKQLLIEQGNQARKDRELTEELMSRKLSHSEQKAVDETLDDMQEMTLDDIRKMNKQLEVSIAASKARIAKLDKLSSDRSYSRYNSHYSSRQEGKYGRYDRHGRNGLHYETKHFPNNNPKHYNNAYELKKDLPYSAQQAFMDEYNQTPYGQENRLMNKYIELYKL